MNWVVTLVSNSALRVDMFLKTYSQLVLSLYGKLEINVIVFESLIHSPNALYCPILVPHLLHDKLDVERAVLGGKIECDCARCGFLRGEGDDRAFSFEDLAIKSVSVVLVSVYPIIDTDELAVL